MADNKPATPAGPWDKFKLNPDAGHAPLPDGPWNQFQAPADWKSSPNAEPAVGKTGQELFETLAGDVAGAIPGIAHTGRALLSHPIDTGRQMLQNTIDLPETLSQEWESGHHGSTLAHMGELGAPLLMKGLGKALEAGAPKVAETAMRVGKRDRMFQANPGKALIEESNSVRPASIASDLSQKGAELSKTLEQNAAGATTPGSLAPAVKPITDRITRATNAGATATADQLVPMRDYFQGEAPPGFAGNTSPSTTGNPTIAPTQSPSQLLTMRREFLPNFRIKYGPTADSTTQQIGRQAYRGISDEVKNVVPGASEIDPRLHDIIAGEDAAESTSRNAGFFQRSTGRLMAHTGALAGSAFGYHMGGIPGAIAGLTLPELATSPTAQMIAARTLQYGGRGLRNSGSLAPAAHPLVRFNQEQQR